MRALCDVIGLLKRSLRASSSRRIGRDVAAMPFSLKDVTNWSAGCTQEFQKVKAQNTRVERVAKAIREGR
jgi:hypothetical protein